MITFPHRFLRPPRPLLLPSPVPLPHPASSFRRWQLNSAIRLFRWLFCSVCTFNERGIKLVRFAEASQPCARGTGIRGSSRMHDSLTPILPASDLTIGHSIQPLSNCLGQAPHYRCQFWPQLMLQSRISGIETRSMSEAAFDEVFNECASCDALHSIKSGRP